MKFVLSYSCGKDSTLALHKMIENGHQPVGLLVVVDESTGRSFFHGADKDLLQRYSEALNILLIPCPTDGTNYHLALEKGLQQAIAMGAEAACFGDIDIEDNRAWAEERCQNAGIPAFFPLWQNDRKANVYELIGLGYKCLIKSVNSNLLPEELLGRYIDKDTIKIMQASNIDICGENGEYHTLVIDGPIFSKPLSYQTGKVLHMEYHSVIEIS